MQPPTVNVSSADGMDNLTTIRYRSNKVFTFCLTDVLSWLKR